MDNNKIEVHFTGFTDLLKVERLSDSPCTFIIENWLDAKSKIGDEEKFYKLDKYRNF